MFGLPAWVFLLKLNLLLTVSMQAGGLEPLNLKWIVVLSAVLRPARVDIFWRQFGRGSPPLDGNGVSFDGGVALGAFALDGGGNKGGVDDLSAVHLHAQINGVSMGSDAIDARRPRPNAVVLLHS